MKKLYILSALFFQIFLISAQTPITVAAGDFASPNDKVVMSSAKVPLPFNYQATGTDTIWDYSFLQYNGQHTDTFLNEYSAPAYYILYFSNTNINPRRSNIARRGQVNTPLIPLLPITETNRFDYFYKSSTSYAQPGFGEQINGIPTPVPYETKDVLYNFPLQFDNSDTSASGYSINIPTVGYYGYHQVRTNFVDGWGTLISPFGTFPVLREFTQITSADSFYISSFNFGLKIPRLTQRQYKWITNGEKEPLLQINSQVLILNIELISSIVYRDSIHPVINGIGEPNSREMAFNLYPNPANNYFMVACPTITENTVLSVSDISGRILLNEKLTENSEMVDASEWGKGIYFVTLISGDNRTTRKLVLQ